MGQLFSRARGHFVTRNLQRFNIESRTEKLLEAEKPVPAPRHARDLEQRQAMLKEEWSRMEKDIKEKNLNHSERLKSVYVNSEDPEGYDADINRRRPYNPSRPLPEKAGSMVNPLQGFNLRPGHVVPKGKVSLVTAQELLNDFKTDVKLNNAGALSARYGVALADAEALTDHYQVFSYIENKKANVTAKMIEDSKDPYRAQPDWVESAGEVPPIKDMKKLDSATYIEIAVKSKEEVGHSVPRDPPKLLPRDNLVADPHRKRVESGKDKPS